jgi:hypothetical protein
MHSDIQDNCNDGEDLTIGSVCASVLTVDLITPHNDFTPVAGEAVTVYEEFNGERRKKGVFLTEKPQKKNSNSTKITAYDNISLFDKDLTEWFNGLDGFPYTAYEMAMMTCEKCGVELKNKNIMNGETLINAVQLPSVTGRQIMRWIGEICGCFCISDENGMVKYDWYKSTNNRISPRRGDGYTHFLRGSLSYEDYTVKKIDGVNIRSEASDSGIVYPIDSDFKNPYIINGNPLILSCSDDDISLIAKNIYETLRDVEYTPSKVGVNSSFAFNVGDIIEIEDINGNAIRSYVMKKHRKGQTETLESRGNNTREGAHSLYSNDFSDSYQEKVKNKQSMASVSQVSEENKARIDSFALFQDEAEKNIANVQVTAAENKAEIASIAKRTTAAETLIAQIDQDVDTERARIDILATFQTEAETAIAEIELDVTANESSIKTLAGRTTAAESAIAGVQSTAGENKASIEAIAKRTTTAETLISQIDQEVDTERARIDILAEFRTETEKNIAKIELDVSENAAKVGLVVGTNASGDYVKGGIIAEAINGQTAVKIKADVLDIDVVGTINAKADEICFISDEMLIETTGFRLEAGSFTALSGTIGGWTSGYDEELKEYVLRSSYCAYGTVSWNDGVYRTVTGYIFTVLRKLGLVYIVKKNPSYTSQTVNKIPSFKSPSFSSMMYDEDGDGVFESEPIPT